MAKNKRDKDSPTFKEATATMTTREKTAYIWEYYRWQIIGSISGMLVVASMLHAFLTQTNHYLHLTVVSGFDHTVRSFQLPDLMDEDIEIDVTSPTSFPEPPPGIWVDFDLIPTLESLFLTDEQFNNHEITVQNLAITFETVQVLATHSGAGVIDIIITTLSDFQTMDQMGYFKNISELGWDVPENRLHNDYGIYLQYFPLFDDYIAAADTLVLGISATTRHIEHVQSFFQTLLD
ncbi:MAG: hypothetical protein FWG67_02825 [Defluviitaleaceae bacterium]|nr:hypothetical protein [Defluviitaleaceae bacterium]